MLQVYHLVMRWVLVSCTVASCVHVLSRNVILVIFFMICTYFCSDLSYLYRCDTQFRLILLFANTFYSFTPLFSLLLACSLLVMLSPCSLSISLRLMLLFFSRSSLFFSIFLSFSACFCFDTAFLCFDVDYEAVSVHV